MTNPLLSISPIDGRYHKKTAVLTNLFSESALMHTRVEVELRYLIALSEAKVIPSFSSSEKNKLASLYENFTLKDALRIKEIESTTRHDVKAVEYWIKEKMSSSSLKNFLEYVHLALTSTDTDNIAYALITQRALNSVLLPEFKKLIEELVFFSKQEKETVMLARTHGQPAVPTTLGKEFALFSVRLARQYANLRRHIPVAKLNGAVGNFNAHKVADSKVDWLSFSDKFIKSLSLKADLFSTQIQQHDNRSELLDVFARVCGIIIDLNRDCWMYISQDRLALKIVAGEIGSSTMPQKINPIDFENSEGNAKIAIGLSQTFSRELLISRMQRDLSDTTVLRNLGVVFAHMLLAIDSLSRGISKIGPNKQTIFSELNSHPEILAEAYQTILRVEGVPNSYELMKDLVRGQKVTLQQMHEFVDELKLPAGVLRQLKELTPQTYTGYANKLTDRALAEARREIS